MIRKYGKRIICQALVMAVCSHISTGAAPAADQITVDPRIPHYQKGGALSGTLTSIGSNTMSSLMVYWEKGFRKYHPTVQIQMDAKGSGTAPAALIAGTAQLGPMSRVMMQPEIKAFTRKHGYEPAAFAVAMDTVAVYVHKTNPIEGLTMEQLAAMFSDSRDGDRGAMTTWGELGLTDEWADAPISLYGRNVLSGTYGYFRAHVLNHAEFRKNLNVEPGSASVVQAISEDQFGIGYSGIGYEIATVRALPLAAKEGLPFKEAHHYQNAVDGSYPLRRQFYLYVNRAPGKPLPPLIAEFLKFVYSSEGQQKVIQAGFFPLPPDVMEQELKKLR